MKSSLTDAYKIVIENFEGPFDLLFYLIEKNEIDIYDIPISEITDQYMEYLFAMQQMDLEIASEFLIMAATLLHIKSRLLLPKKKDENSEEEIDPKEELIMRLVEYKKYKEFSTVLKEKESYWCRAFYKLPEIIPQKQECIELTPNSLITSYKQIMKAYKEKQNDVSKKMDKILQHEKVSVKSKIKEILAKISHNIKVGFSSIFNVNKKSKLEIATGFLAMLELVKLNKAEIEQDKEFSEIYITRKEE